VVTDGRATLLFTSPAGDTRLRAQGLAGATIMVETAPVDAAGRLELAAVMRRLADLECNEVLVEAGPRLAGGVVAAGLADEIVLYLAPTLLGDTARAAFALPEPLRSLAERRLYRYQDVRVVGDDLRVTLRPREGSD
jgi:diaminohydroxyphosphoribosylaminopyrimidine deaminase/5-amino-6-(5-phosphoribosylamino)uracil reductase